MGRIVFRFQFGFSGRSLRLWQASGPFRGSLAGRRTVLRIRAVIIFLLGKSTSSLAGPCAAGSLRSYVDLGQGGCTFAGLLFNNFDYTPSADGASEIPASDVTVGLISSEPRLRADVLGLGRDGSGT